MLQDEIDTCTMVRTKKATITINAIERFPFLPSFANVSYNQLIM